MEHITLMRKLPNLILLFFIIPNFGLCDEVLQKTTTIEKLETPYGAYHRFRPVNLKSDFKILALIHGSIGERSTAEIESLKYIKLWIKFAEKNNLLLIAPAFDKKNFQSYGGYRGLFGRKIGADQFLNIVLEENRNVKYPSDKFYLYGHSAGGQFLIRYLLTHPQNVAAAVASAPGRYSYPDQNIPWPYGAGRIEKSIKYSEPDEIKSTLVEPNFENFIKALEVPLTIVAGAEDTKLQPSRPGHSGISRIDFAKDWIEKMNRFAKNHGRKSNAELLIIPKIGHDSAKLGKSCKLKLQHYLAVEAAKSN